MPGQTYLMRHERPPVQDDMVADNYVTMMRWQDSRGNQREREFLVDVEDMGMPIGLQQRRLSVVS